VSRAPTIARRELASYFHSPVAYVALFLFVLATGYAFYRDFQPGQPAGMRTLFDWMVWFLVFIIPVLSMGLMAQEWASGTIETLMTAPVEEADVVIGKFLGSFLLFGLLLVPTLVYVVMLRIYARPDFGPIFSGYLGILLVGALFIAIGISKFNPDPHGMWFQIFEKIGFGQWFRVMAGVMQVAGGVLLFLPGTSRVGAAAIGATMVGAMLTDVFVLGNPIMVIAPGGLLAAVAIAGFRDPTLDSTIATLEQRKRLQRSIR